MSAAVLAGALAQLLVSLALGWIVADVALRAAGGHIAKQTASGLPEGAGLPERTLLALAGFVALSVALMFAHIVTGGAVFGTPVVVPLAGVTLLVLGARRFRLPRGIHWLPVAVLFAALIALYVTPVLLEGSGVRAGDSTLHMGWTEQLLDGEPTPPGPAPEFGRNAYPWGFHAVMATMIRLVPGTDMLVAQEALHLLLLIGIPVAAACLARRIRIGAGWAGAVGASLIGGWGWISARGWHFDASPTEARYGADLVAASPNSVYELMVPALPRELGLVLLGATALLLVLAVRTEDRKFGILAGICAGMVGLVSVPLFVSAVLWIAVGAFIAGKGARRTMLYASGIPALVVFALWAGPVVAAYVRFGGFVNVTSTLGREWPLTEALLAWGLLLPLAVAGLVLAVRSGTTGTRVLLGFAVTVVVLLMLARLRGAFGWNLANNATLLHQGRVWPVAHLLGAAFGGVALDAVYELVRARARLAAPALMTLVIVLGAASPVLAAGGITEILDDHRKGFIFGSDDFADDSFVRRAAAELDSGDVVQAPDDPNVNVLGFWLFQFSGARLVGHIDPRYEGNELRIRYRDLAREYAETVDNGGFEPDYLVEPLDAGVSPDRVIAEGDFGGERWALVATR